MFAPVTSIYAALLALLMIALAYRVVAIRRGKKIGIGVSSDHEMERAVRVHGNFTEYVPLALLLMLLLELQGLSPFVLHLLGATLMLARVAHAQGLGRTVRVSPGRYYGTLVTWSLIVGMALTLLIRPLF